MNLGVVGKGGVCGRVDGGFVRGVVVGPGAAGRCAVQHGDYCGAESLCLRFQVPAVGGWDCGEMDGGGKSVEFL